MPDESHTHEPWTAASESDPPATSTQPGRAEVVDQIKQVAESSTSDHAGDRRVSTGYDMIEGPPSFWSAMTDQDATQTFVRLKRGEQIVWQGRPVRRRLFRISDLAVVGSVVAMAVLIVLLARVGFFGSTGSTASLALLVPGVQLCALVVQVTTRALWWRRTGYVVTTRRVVISGGRSGKIRTSQDLAGLESPVMVECADGFGSLAFGRFPGVRDSFARDSLPSRWWRGHRRWSIGESTRPVLWDVPNVQQVRDHVVKAQRAATRRTAARPGRNAERQRR
jgi:hypothetical protein